MRIEAICMLYATHVIGFATTAECGRIKSSCELALLCPAHAVCSANIEQSSHCIPSVSLTVVCEGTRTRWLRSVVRPCRAASAVTRDVGRKVTHKQDV